MAKYLLSVHGSADAPPRPQPSPEEMAAYMQRIAAVEAELDANGSFVFGGALHGPDAATVVRHDQGKTLMTDGPFVEAREHIAGFYIIAAEDLDEALAWGAKVTEAVGQPIEVRPFAADGRVEA